MKPFSYILFLVAFNYSNAQTDTIYTTKEKISCVVKEIAPDLVKYTYVGEDVINSIYKNTVLKIVFKSGRVQVFAEPLKFNKIISPNDYAKVTFTQAESEIQGLYKIAEVMAKARGTTTLSSIQNVRERAHEKLKIFAALNGANVVWLTQQQTAGNQYGNNYSPGRSTETFISGIAYSDYLPDYNEFMKLINAKSTFRVIYKYKLWNSGTELEASEYESNIKNVKFKNDKDFIVFSGELFNFEGHVYRVTYFTNKYFLAVTKDNEATYSLRIALD
ncbi:MAG: hypothetical protein SFY32_12460 [Bacteroidota bacterium]|nr:hypothetical protein [Bacteroidota bacterium]